MRRGDRTAAAVRSAIGRMHSRVAGLLEVLSAAVFASLGACSAPSGVPAQSESASSAPWASLAESDAAVTDVAAKSTVPLSATTPTVPPAAPAPVSAPPHPAPRQRRLVFTGDVLSPPVTDGAYANGSSDDVSADVAQVLALPALTWRSISRLRSSDNTDLSGYPLFNAPGDLSRAAEVGYDGCSVSSNHSLDRGIDGIEHWTSGPCRHGANPCRGYDAFDLRRERPSSSYTYGLNDIPASRHVIDPDAIAAEAQAAVAAGAEFVILSIQWGAEYTSVPNASQRRLANNLLERDIDLIVGSQPMYNPSQSGRQVRDLRAAISLRTSRR